LENQEADDQETVDRVETYFILLARRIGTTNEFFLLAEVSLE
jgi:hypothetical protein